MSRRLAAANNLVFSYATVAFNAISGLLLLPLYLRHFNLATYGLWLACANGVALLSLLEAGFTLVFAQRLATTLGRGHQDAFPEVAGSGAIVALVLSLLVLIAGVSIGGAVPGWVGAGAEESGALAVGFRLATVGASASIAYYALGAVMQAWQRTFWAGITGVAALVFGIAATLWALWSGWGVMSIGLGMLVRGVAGLAMLAALVVRLWRREALPAPRWTGRMVKDLARETLPVSVSQSAAIVLGNSQSVIVTVLVSPSAAATLSVMGRSYEFCKMFLAPVGSAVFAGLAQIVGTGDRVKLREVATDVTGIFAATAALGLGWALALNEAFVRNWVGLEVPGGHALSVALSVAAAAFSIVLLLRTMLTAFGEIRRTAWASVAEVFVRLPTIVVMVWSLGLIGMPLAELLSTVGVCGWFFGRVWVASLDVHGRDRLRIAVNVLAPLMAAMLLGGVWSWLAPVPGGWASFAGQALASGALLAALVLALSASMRHALGGLGRRATGIWTGLVSDVG